MPQIRPYRPADRDGLYDVCVKTADSGSDATGILSDDRLWGDIWAVPYAERHPDLCWVVESDDSRVIGYIVATDDTLSFERWFHDVWWPTRVGEYPVPPVPGHERQTWVMSYAAARGGDEEPNAAEYPAHLHIDLLPETQGMGLGRRLTELLFAELADRGVAGLHLGMNPDNVGAGKFYERLGMQVLPSDEGVRVYGVRFGAPPAIG
ncbi:MAG: GNAT family N-acetyltransferase [Microbacterium sp.]|nr:GNAT family N-acetyltransferase [Microbacterium sp.]